MLSEEDPVSATKAATVERPGLQSSVAELVGTALLLAVVVGSGISAERLAQGNIGLALLVNALATGAGLVALILAFGPMSGAHFNPAVTLVEAAAGRMRWKLAAAYIALQIAGAFAGVALAHAMYNEPLFSPSAHVRAGSGQLVSEGVATFGLLLTILSVARWRPSAVPYAVGAYISSAYWFTASSSFANPAVTLARAATQTFAGIRPMDVPGFVLAQLVGAAAAAVLFRWLSAADLPAVEGRHVHVVARIPARDGERAA